MRTRLGWILVPHGHSALPGTTCLQQLMFMRDAKIAVKTQPIPGESFPASLPPVAPEPW